MGRHARNGPLPPQVTAESTGHGHGHGHRPAGPAGRRVRLLLAVLLVPCALGSVLGALLLYPFGEPRPATTPGADQQRIEATVVATTPADCTQGAATPSANDAPPECLALSVRMETGRSIVIVVPVEPTSPRFAVDDEVVLAYAGSDPEDPASYVISDFQRGTALWVLALLFAGSVILLGRWRGLAALIALGVTFTVLVGFMLPAILNGRSPLAVAVVGSGLIMFAVLYLSHGFSARTSTAVFGTLASLGLIGVLGTVFAEAARLTALDEQTAVLIASLEEGSTIDPRGLLLAGFVIGALGVLDDVTVTQTSAVWELRRANPLLGPAELFTSAMRIGRDHVSSAVNTLVLAYAGAALPLLLLFTLVGRNVGQSLNSQSVATEIVRTLVGSIGLVASVPITTGVAALVASREPTDEPARR